MKFIIAILLLAAPLSAAEPIQAEQGMVVSSHRLASEVGVDVLKADGNAIDAAIATGLALAVVHPSAGNIGGGGFMVVLTKNGEATTFDFREKAPAAASEKMYLDGDGKYIKDLNHEGYLSVGVPGTIAGFDLALKRFGTKSWRELAGPAVKLASEGFALSAAQGRAFEKLTNDWRKYPSSGKVFLHADRSIYRGGETWKQPELARTLERIQQNGRAGFYGGKIAQEIEADMRDHGGIITTKDLADYHAVERKPVNGAYKGYTIYSMPPPSSGGVALVEMLNILEPFDLPAMEREPGNYLHVLAETMRRAYADRARHLGDPDFNSDMPIADLTSKEHARHLRASIQMNHASVSDPGKFAQAYESPETTHYSVIDKEGNAVVVTYTLEYAYGSRIVARGLGFLYNNEMGDFNAAPGVTDANGFIGTPPNLIAPGKRMLSSMTPTIVAKDGKPVLLIGSPGGRTIINTVLQVILNVTDFHMNIADAIAAPRIHHQWLPDQIQYERSGFAAKTNILNGLQEKGHKLAPSEHIGEAMGILVNLKTNARSGAADPRSPDGAAIGY